MNNENRKYIEEYIEEYNSICNIFANILDCPSKGGNISVKDKNYMIIKASGEDLKKKHRISIFKDNKNLLSYYNGNFSKDILKPSMEINMHLVFKNKYVVHYHPVYLLPYLCSDFLFKEYDFIEFTLPGEKLSEKLKKSYMYKEKGILMLQNHGVILYSEYINDLFIMHSEIKDKFFENNFNIYTPDDAIDYENYELWLFRNTIENIALKKDLKLNQIGKIYIDKIINMPDEKYRKMKIKKENE
ncbi:class II aldolase/adducin family protein [Campylobacter sp. RM9929]|uniref:class II aldolase/adducin family protein n=1 Tax=Campylobacter molothri TaxID=1032242 RepID=UPI001D3B3C9A|nr:class II aldolase/adducin family protein [Campylobacter sp. RM9929]MBZ7955605.1 class II aldolase/adducin family protein [Campylobacter sp. RM17709]